MTRPGYEVSDDVRYVLDVNDANYSFCVPCDLIKDIGTSSANQYPYICFLIAHDIDPCRHCDDGMERFYFRIWASSEDEADEIFINLPEIKEYIKDRDLDADSINSIYDIDQWDALVTVLERQ